MNRDPRVWVAAGFLTVLSAASGGFFGFLATAMYWGELAGGGTQRTLLGVDAGLLLGAVLGVVLGIAWCWATLRRTEIEWKRGPRKKLVAAPVGYGMLAGMISAALLHLGLQVVYGFDDALGKHAVGQIFGFVAGGFVAAIGTRFWPPVRKAPPTP